MNKEKHSDSRERYIVQLYDDPIIAHGSTKPSKNAKLDPNDALVVEYGTYLETRQDEAVATIGGKKLWSYKYAFNGFAIKMTEAEAKAMKNRSDVLSVQRDEVREVETDTSADFLGLTGGGEPWSMGYTGEDVVLGILDTGVNPEHPSFADIETPENGNIGNNIPYGAPPAGFTGTICDFGQQDFNPNDAPAECSNKLLTARCYAIGFSDVVDPSLPCGGDGAELVPWEFFSARDSDGHGSHVQNLKQRHAIKGILEDGREQVTRCVPDPGVEVMLLLPVARRAAFTAHFFKCAVGGTTVSINIIAVIALLTRIQRAVTAVRLDFAL